MNPLNKIFSNTIKLFDLVVMLCSFALAMLVSSWDTSKISLSDFLAMRITVQNFALILGFLLLWHTIFSYVGLYSRRSFSVGSREAFDILKASFVGTLAIGIAALVFEIEVISGFFLAVFWIVDGAITILSRLAFRYSLRRRRPWRQKLKHLLIVGTNRRALEMARQVQSSAELGYHLVGFVDDHWSGNGEIQKTGYSLVTDFSGFHTYIKDHVVDEVMICTPVRSFYEQSSRILAQCEEQGITVRFISDVFTPTRGTAHTEDFADHLVVTINTGAITGRAVLIKRLLDFYASFAFLIVLSPLFLIIALLIKSSSPGPVFFVQERMGLNKRRFRLYKFRTMVPDAEAKLAQLEHLNEASGPVFKIKRDPRITPIGMFLRKSSIDELPQLINVVKGDMSLVGPRPLPVRDYEGFNENWHRRRFSVRPGMTCLWQILGRSSIPFEKWMELDMHYIDNWSLLLDIKILVKTIPAVLRGRGAS